MLLKNKSMFVLYAALSAPVWATESGSVKFAELLARATGKVFEPAVTEPQVRVAAAGGERREVTAVDRPPVRENPLKAPPATDASFVATRKADRCIAKGEERIILEFEMPRLLTKLPIREAIEKGLVKPTQAIDVSAFDVDVAFGEYNRAVLNGKPIGYLNGGNDRWSVTRFVVNTTDLNWPTYTGSTPIPAINTLEIEVDVQSKEPTWCTAVDWIQLRVVGWYPVVLAHGRAASPKTWTDFRVLQTLEEAGFPVEAPQLPKGRRAFLQALGLESTIRRITTAYGVKHVHLIAHSFGGRTIRALFTGLAGQLELRTSGTIAGVGILSASCISCPHYGSVVSSSVLTFSDPWAVSDDRTIIPILGRLASPVEADRELDVEFSQRAVEREGPLMPTGMNAQKETSIYYVAMGGDANRDGSQNADGGTIDRNEAYGLMHGWYPVATSATAIYQMVESVHSFRLERRTAYVEGHPVADFEVVVREVRYDVRQRNDVLVTEASARWPIPHQWFPRNGVNHASIVDTEALNTILRAIAPANDQMNNWEVGK